MMTATGKRAFLCVCLCGLLIIKPAFGPLITDKLIDEHQRDWSNHDHLANWLGFHGALQFNADDMTQLGGLYNGKPKEKAQVKLCQWRKQAAAMLATDPHVMAVGINCDMVISNAMVIAMINGNKVKQEYDELIKKMKEENTVIVRHLAQCPGAECNRPQAGKKV